MMCDVISMLGDIQVLCNAMEGGGMDQCRLALQRCMLQSYCRYDGVGCPIFFKKALRNT